jgi:REP element-mobilizing transposase RayT
MPDHVQVFLCERPSVAPSQIVLYLKGWTSSTLGFKNTKISELLPILSVLAGMFHQRPLENTLNKTKTYKSGFSSSP